MDLETKHFSKTRHQQNLFFVCFITNKYNTKTLLITSKQYFSFSVAKKNVTTLRKICQHRSRKGPILHFQHFTCYKLWQHIIIHFLNKFCLRENECFRIWSTQREQPSTVHCPKALTGLRCVQGENKICVYSSPLRSVKSHSEAVLKVVAFVSKSLLLSIVHEEWSWLCPWKWPLHSSRAGHQGLLHPVPLLSSEVMSAWKNFHLEPWPPQASPSDTVGLRHGKNNKLLIHHFEIIRTFVSKQAWLSVQVQVSTELNRFKKWIIHFSK